MNTQYQQKENEDFLDWKIRLVVGKIDKSIDLDWIEIRDLLKLDCSPDHLRKTSYGIYETYKYLTNSTTNNTRILSVSDLHVPYNLDINILAKYKDKIDILLINGDVTDCQSLSKFSKKYRIPFIEELIETRKIIMELNELLKPTKIIINYGNHDERLSSYFSNNIHEDLMSLMPKTSLDLIVDQGFYNNNHKDGTKTKYEPLVNLMSNIMFTGSWYYQLGQTIFCHPKAYRQGILGTTEKVWQYMNQHGYNFNSLVVAHTHQLGFYKYGKCYIYEQGSFCGEQEYAINGKLSRPQNHGYIYIEQDSEGKLIYEKCKLENID